MVTYREAGVNIDAGDETVRRIKPLVRKTFTEGVLRDIGGFGGFFDLGHLNAYAQPVLVSSVDGVGTKLKVAFLAERHDTVGEDLVNHCVNDIAVCGAVPLFFLDYFSVGRLDPDVAVQVISGFARGCEANGCALIGGETAEMPDLYQPGEYDLAGTVVGIVDRTAIVDGAAVQESDVLLGLPSNGLHTNGYSLARKVLFSRFSVNARPAELDGESVGECLLRVHTSYLRPIRALVELRLVSAMAHVTGGGIVGNLSRVVPEGLRMELDWNAWEVPPIFRLIQEIGGVPADDMRRTFNLGVGLVVAVRKEDAGKAISVLQGTGADPFRMGTIERGADTSEAT